MLINASTTLTSAEWTGILYDLILFECSGKYASVNNECPIVDITDALLNAWYFQQNNAYRFNCPYDNFIGTKVLHSSDSIKTYITSLRSHTFSIFPRQLFVGTRYIFTRIDNDKQAVQRQHILSLPRLSDGATNAFLDRYAALVPSYYHDDFAALVLYIRNNWWTHGGSGGSTCMLLNGLKGVVKLSKKHTDKKRLVITPFPPGELERLRLLARQLKDDTDTRPPEDDTNPRQEDIDAVIRQKQELTRMEAQQKEQDQIRQQGELSILQQQLEAMRLEAMRLEATRMEAMRLEAMRLEATRLEAMRLKDEAEQKMLPQLKEKQEPMERGQGVATITQYMAILQTSQMSTNDNINSVRILHRVLQENLRRYTGRENLTVHLFGSFESGLSSITSDADFTVYNFVSRSGGDLITELAKALQWSGCEAITTIASAQVPIVSFTARELQCDISIDQPMGVINSKLIATYRRIDNRFLTLWFAVRQIAKTHDILSSSTGYLSSYALTMMLIVFLQDVTNPPILPKLQQREPRHMVSCKVNGHDCSFDRSWGNFEKFTGRNTKSTGELLVDFCRFYGYLFKYATEEVNPRLGAIKPRSFNPPPRKQKDNRPNDWPMCVMDPFITDRNVAGNCRSNNVVEIQKCFQDAFDALNVGDIYKVFKQN
ncbi:MAG: hypothetical protein J3R72DRAFT_460698 [Linnemannia gamsii]|nr:MAG: hypothetical protein J3R72DRAFT_460698 [Linnemannia gamsii]